MACIEKIYSVSALVGSGECNGNCSFCSGQYLRKQAWECVNSPTRYHLYLRNLEAAIKLSAGYRGWSLSLTSSGEPTCSPLYLTRALDVYKKCADQGRSFPNVNLFTNGLNFADPQFCSEWLPLWSRQGLNNVAISVHSVDHERQMRAYGRKGRYEFVKIRENIERHGLGVRATLLLHKGEADNGERYGRAIDTLIDDYGYRNITSWPVGKPDGSRNEYTPSRLGLLGIRAWLLRNAKMCHGHSWGGGVYDYKGSIVRFTDYVTRHDPKKDFVRQLVVFQDGVVAYSWIREGALCMR